MADSKEPKQQSSDHAIQIFPPYLLLFVFIPALPFFFGGSTLSFFINPTSAAYEYLDKSKTTQKESAEKLLAVDPECKTINAPGCVQ